MIQMLSPGVLYELSYLVGHSGYRDSIFLVIDLRDSDLDPLTEEEIDYAINYITPWVGYSFGTYIHACIIMFYIDSMCSI